MTDIHDSPDREGESSSKEDHKMTPNVLLKTPEIFSQLHLVRDNDNPDCYSYHLDPSLPAAYSLLGDSKTIEPLYRKDHTLVLMGAAVEGLVGDEEETRQQLASCTVKRKVFWERKSTLPLWTQLKIFSHTEGYEGAESQSENGVDVQVFWTSSQLEAKWAMSVPLPQPNVDPQTPILEPASEKNTVESEEIVEKNDPQFYSVVLKSKPARAHQRTPTVYHEKTFEWMQDSPGRSFKLTFSPEDSPVAEFILEASEQRKAQGVKGQLFFRDYCGKEWEGVVLASLGALMYIQDLKGLDNLTSTSGLDKDFESAASCPYGNAFEYADGS
ncbi:hypothetical protein HYALB_00007043 [Hymenoscyphus albidus]|uniref:Uncharacterized protein n=1 Tax=Hymenoscyphus albidus TaxID=595503 RepID=A0A9N9PWE6_9HELO|nr:hypothetical protein HYALB_00007043 [Hymenoscyphus albidus]